MGDTINDLVLGNGFIAPCLLRVVCSVVSEASHSDNPTSTDKIIDGLSRYSCISNPRDWIVDISVSLRLNTIREN